jgi:hypothetical protein
MNFIEELILKIYIGRNKEMFDKIRGFFAGKKTYIGALGTIIGTVVAWHLGKMPPDVAFWAIVTALGLGSLKMKVSQVGGVFGKYVPYLVVLGQIIAAVTKWTQDGNTLALITEIMAALGLTGLGNATGKALNGTPLPDQPNQ